MDMPDKHPVSDLKKWLESLDRSMAQLHAFQVDTLRVHAAYLQDQLECSAALIQATATRFFHDQPTRYPQAQTLVPPIVANAVQLKQLPKPDRLDMSPSVCLLTDDGTAATTAVAQALQALGWSIVVLRFPTAVVARQSPLPAGTTQIRFDTMDEQYLHAQLATLANPIGSFIYLHPPFPLATDAGLCFSATEKALISQVFFIAKYLKDPLTRPAPDSRPSFITVMRLDGHLGLGEKSTFSPLAGGLFGLVKSLNLEWPAVFCRAIDLDPAIDTKQVAACLIDELYDPDRQLAEVGVGPQGRFTLTLST